MTEMYVIRRREWFGRKPCGFWKTFAGPYGSYEVAWGDLPACTTREEFCVVRVVADYDPKKKDVYAPWTR